jgi:outer membrane protein OmpA-like peptidoglycan-associated protein
MTRLSKACASSLQRLERLILLSAMALVPGPVTGWAVQAPAAAVRAAVNPASTKAFNYQNLTGTTRVAFRGTVLMPEARGGAKVKNHGGALLIKAKFENLEPPVKFGSEYLTYVLWAVTPVGRPVNLGEVIVRKHGRATLEARTNLQTFGLIVTAEPHFAVTQVGNPVVLENEVTPDTRGQVEEMATRYELLPREAYGLEPGATLFPPGATVNAKINPYVFQAHNAVRLARAGGAEAFAPTEYNRALELLGRMQAEKKQWKKPAIVLARQVVQQAEDARLIAVKVQEQARLDQERLAAETARREAESARAETENVRSQAEAARLLVQQAQEQAALEARKAQDEASRTVSSEKLALRRKLRDQLSRLLDTRETERGVVVSLSDLLFPSGKASLLPATREKLAKIAGILLSYPGVRMTVEGHTDSTGNEQINARLSRQRAHAVRSFLIRQGLAPEAVAARGLGSSVALASNETVAGRQQNRRVELILTGGAIGF